MTDLRELGEMLIEVADNGREIEFRKKHGAWTSKPLNKAFHFDLDTEYRLKPKVTYYRVYAEGGALVAVVDSKPFEKFATWKADLDDTLIHDFEIET